MTPTKGDESPGWLDRALRPFSEVRAGEGPTALLMLVNLFLLLLGYYVVKTVREALILASPPPSWISSGAEMKSYASAGQALTLMAFIPLYGWFSSRVGRMRLILGSVVFFIVGMELFYMASLVNVPYLGFAFFIWVGIFNNAAIAQFWSYANDIYRKDAGERLFPIIAIGAAAGSPLGAKVAEWLFRAGVRAYDMLHITGMLLLVHLGLYWIVNRRESRRTEQSRVAATPLAAGSGGFALILSSPYLRLVALLIVLLNLVNTTGEYLVDRSLEAAADTEAVANPSFDRQAFIGAFKGDFFFWVNVIAVLLQALIVSRLAKYAGLAGVILALPMVALGAYGLIALGAGFAVVRWAKTAENSTDYSVMNTGRQMIWLPTSREEKYKAKQAVDTFFVRIGDVLSAVAVFVGAAWLKLRIEGFAFTNLLLVLLWVVVAVLLLREHRRLVARSQAPAAALAP